METGYLEMVIQGIEPVFDAIQDPYDRQFILAATMTRCLNCNSLLDLSETFASLSVAPLSV